MTDGTDNDLKMNSSLLLCTKDLSTLGVYGVVSMRQRYTYCNLFHRCRRDSRMFHHISVFCRRSCHLDRSSGNLNTSRQLENKQTKWIECKTINLDKLQVYWVTVARKKQLPIFVICCLTVWLFSRNETIPLRPRRRPQSQPPTVHRVYTRVMIILSVNPAEANETSN